MVNIALINFKILGSSKSTKRCSSTSRAWRCAITPTIRVDASTARVTLTQPLLNTHLMQFEHILPPNHGYLRNLYIIDLRSRHLRKFSQNPVPKLPYITLSTENTQVLFINRCLAFIKIVAFYVQPHINAHFSTSMLAVGFLWNFLDVTQH